MYSSINLALGIVIGIAIGIIMGKKQKSWSELTPAEKKFKIGLIIALSISALLGVVVFVWLYYQAK